MSSSASRLLCGLVALLLLAGSSMVSAATLPEAARRPVIMGPWTQITGNPDLGELTGGKQQPVDFAIWQAADGTWQVLECIRGTKEAGNTRLFYRWEGKNLTDASWKPTGIAMRADASLGETPGGLQAPYVFRDDAQFQMFYGDWNHICRATSADGKTFTRVLQANGQAGLFGEGDGTNTRDPMVLKTGGAYYCYDAAYPAGKCSDFCRTSADLKSWSARRQVAFGGSAGTGKFSAECPFVVEAAPGEFYLFRTQRYGQNAQTSVYFSRDPLDFGVDHDAGHFVCTLPIAAPEIVRFGDKYYVAALLPSLAGIQIARLEWAPMH